MKKLLVISLTLIMILSSYSPTFAVDSYSEYFSEEREFVVNDDTYNYSTYFYSDDETGYLYSRNVDTKEVQLVFSQNVATHYLWNEHLYCVVDGKNIVKISITGQNPETILTTNNSIEQLYVNDDIIFYLSDNAIYRFHRESERTDLIASDENIYFFYPYTNFIVEYGDGSENQEIKRTGIASRSTNSLNTYTFLTNSTGTAANTTYKIHGITVPYSPYTHGKYFNTSNTSPCPCHPNDPDCSSPSTCGSCKSENGSYQCAAFAHTVHKKIWGNYGTKVNYYDDIHTAALAREVFWNIPSGTTVRTALRGNYTNSNLPSDSVIQSPNFSKHSFIVTNVTETGVTVYEANWPKACIIKHITLTFEELAERYIDVCWIFDTSHTFGSTYEYNNSIHWKKCTSQNCNGKTNIGYHQYQLNSQGLSVCSVCNYPNPASMNNIPTSAN